MTRPAALALQGITKRFGEVTALDGADFTAGRGTVHALLGENGAGKTTLMRIAFGLLRPDAGSVSIEGRRATLRSPADAIAAGIGMVHQHFALVPTMTVAENVALGGHGPYSARAAAERVRSVGRASGMMLDPGARAGDLPVSGQQRLEIVKALARDARILVLDEPTAVLAPAEIQDLLRRLREFADGGRTVVLVTHKLREALSIADTVTVLRHGATVYSAPAAGASEDRLADAILGRGGGPAGIVTEPTLSAGIGTEMALRAGVEEELALLAGADVAGKHPPLSGEHELDTNDFVDPGSDVPVFTVQQLTIKDDGGTIRIREATFSVRRGEILGVAGVEGAGHRELLRALAGRLAPAGGSLHLPAEVGFVPEDRQADALILGFPLVENVALRGAGQRHGSIPWQALERRTQSLLTAFDVRASSPWAQAVTLSGGNQQKLVLARELENAPAGLVVENPTRGLDIQAAAAVHARLRAAAGEGTAVVVHSSDLDEVIALADRVLVVFAGSVTEVARDRDAVGRGILGLA